MNARRVGLGAAVVALAVLAAWVALDVAPRAPEAPRAEARREAQVRPERRAPASSVASSAPTDASATPRGLKGRARVPVERLEDPTRGGSPLEADAQAADAGGAGWAALASGEDWADPEWFPDGAPLPDETEETDLE